MTKKDKLETLLVVPNVRKIALPNKKHGKKININCLLNSMSLNESFKAHMDNDLNPYQNWVEINIVGKAKIFPNGTVLTDINLPDEALIVFFDKIYKAYVKECLE